MAVHFSGIAKTAKCSAGRPAAHLAVCFSEHHPAEASAGGGGGPPPSGGAMLQLPPWLQTWPGWQSAVVMHALHVLALFVMGSRQCGRGTPFMSVTPAHCVSFRHWTHCPGVTPVLQTGVFGVAATHCASVVQFTMQLLFTQAIPAPQSVSVKHSSQVSLGRPAMFMPTVSQKGLPIWFGFAAQSALDVHWTQRLLARSQMRLLPFGLQPVLLLAVPQAMRPASLPGMPPVPVVAVPALPPAPVAEPAAPVVPVAPPVPAVDPPSELLLPQAAKTNKPAVISPLKRNIL